MKNIKTILLTAFLAMSSVTTTQASVVRIDGDPNGGANSTVVFVGDDPSPTKSGVNNVRMHLELFEFTGVFPEGYYVEDSAGVTAGAGCTQQSSTVAICGRGGIPAKVIADLKGGNDIFTPESFGRFSGLIFAPDPVTIVNGGAGDDTINGNQNNDILSGGPGNDTINGQIGDDTIFGGSGNDTINGNSGKDTINGQGGNDQINGNENDDVVLGGAGQDTIWGGSGKDRINAGDGDDFVASEDKESDNVVCGLGLDRVKVGLDHSVPVIDIISRDCEDLF
jgi:Ca2+-binding RTX toxin-like protein